MGRLQRLRTTMSHPLGRFATGIVALLVCVAPAWLFADLLRFYRLHSDDFAYVAAARTLPRALAALFVPHNTHVVPVWRLLTWALIAAAGRLSNLQVVFAGASYASLAAVMLLLGRLVARETGRATIGLAAMAVAGSSALVTASATWFSASQTLWASFGILATLWYLQGYRARGGIWRLVMAGLCTWLAAGCWSVGHAAGPVGAVYLWTDGRPRSRRVAWVPLAATLVAVALAFALGGRKIDTTVSFGGRTPLQAANPVQGVFHTLQAIPEDLVFGNLGLTAATTLGQGAVLTLGFAACWACSVWKRGRASPLECAGGALLVLSFLVEWTVRGYLPYSSLRGAVPWYDTIPQVGFVLWLAGWWAGRGAVERSAAVALPTRAEALGVLLFQAALLALAQPRVEAYLESRLPPITAEENQALPIPSLRHLRTVWVAQVLAEWQHRTWQRLEQAERVARPLGIGRAQITAAYGKLLMPDLPESDYVVEMKRIYLPADYEVASMLDLPPSGTLTDPARIHQALDPFLQLEPNPAPPNAVLKMLGEAGFRGPQPAPNGRSGR